MIITDNLIAYAQRFSNTVLYGVKAKHIVVIIAISAVFFLHLAIV